jgi:hypothetical protein
VLVSGGIWDLMLEGLLHVKIIKFLNQNQFITFDDWFGEGKKWYKYSPIPAQYKQLWAWPCLFILGLGVAMSSSSSPYPTKWGRYNMFFIMLWYRFGIYFYDRPPAWRQPFLELEWVLTIANATGTNGLTCLPKQRGARDNKLWSPILRVAIETGA